MTKTTSALPLIVVLAVLAAGCGRTDPTIDPQQRELQQIHGIYRMYMKNHQRPPAALSDLKQYEPVDPTALQLLREGKYLVVWGVSDKSSETVLAYEKDAPTKGGMALMADGTVKRLDAQAFQSIPKAKG